MPRNNQRTDVSRQELQRLEARLTSLAGRTARQASDSDELPVDAVDTVNIANDAVTEDKIADGAVTFKKLASGGTTSGGGGNYSSQAETRRSGATETVEVYYTARPDGDGYAESEVTTSTPAGYVIKRKLYFSDKFNADPDTSGDWTLYTTQPAENTAFATAKASLLAGLSDTDGTANTRGTLPVSLKMTHRFAQDLLLEDFPGAAAAYSLRKISSDYTGSAIRIREDGTNTETDIGFDSNGDLDTAAIATHCGSNNGFVKIWYDQSGNSNDATQSTAANQPQIYNGSAVITENGKPTIDFDGSNDSLISALTVNTTDLAVSSVQTFDSLAGGQMGITISEASLNQLYLPYNNTANNWIFKYKAVDQNFTADTNQNLISFYTNGTSTYFYKNGATLGSALTASALVSSNGVRIGAFSSGTLNADINCQELIIWQSDQSANRTDIEADISAYWQSNKRTLDAYPGAAAAYSVRKLDNDYTGSALRVREDSGNTEADIGFDSNGNLDTAAIASHCGSANGYVVTWYDQSGNSNDATQSTTTKQPQIYDGSAVITQNSKPCLYFPTTQHMTASGAATVGSRSRSQWSVFSLEAGTNYAMPWAYGLRSQIQPPDTNLKPNLFVQRTGGTPSITAASGINLNRQYLRCDIADTVTAESFIDGSSVLSGSDNDSDWSTSDFGIGFSSGDRGPFKVAESILYESDQSSNRSGIESNINTYYTIY